MRKNRWHCHSDILARNRENYKKLRATTLMKEASKCQNNKAIQPMQFGRYFQPKCIYLSSTSRGNYMKSQGNLDYCYQFKICQTSLSSYFSYVYLSISYHIICHIYQFVSLLLFFSLHPSPLHTDTPKNIRCTFCFFPGKLMSH